MRRNIISGNSFLLDILRPAGHSEDEREDEMSVEAAAPAYEISQEALDLRDMVRRLAQEKIAPRAGEIDRKSEYPWDVRELLASHDVLGLPFDSAYGGTGT